jgi:hypothetical protein
VVEPVEEVALAEEVSLGGVHVLPPEGVVLVQLPGLEAAHPTSDVGEREQQPTGEVVVAPPVDEPSAGELVPREAGLGGRAHERGSAGSETEPEVAGDLLSQPARGEVVASEGASLRLPEVALVERRGAVEQLEEALAPLARAVLLGRRLLVLERDAEAVGEPLDRPDEVEVLLFLDEGDRVSTLAAAEALEGAAVRRDAEARRLLLVEGAEADEAAPGLAQAGVGLDQRDDVRRLLDGLDGRVLDPRDQSLSA